MATTRTLSFPTENEKVITAVGELLAKGPE